MSLFKASLPQKDGRIGKEERKLALVAARVIYDYAYGAHGLDMPMAKAQGPIAQAALHLGWVAGQAGNLIKLAEDVSAWKKSFGKDGTFETLADYTRIFTTKPVPQIVSTWQSDDAFCDQRVAGLNPMILERVSLHGDTGSHWDTLKSRLARTDDAVLEQALGKGATWQTAIENRQIFVADYRMLSTIVADDDATGDEAGRRVLAPIGVFARRTDEEKLRPVLVQLGQTPKSPVHTPNPSPAWLMAKTYLQTADVNYNQLINHLGLVHLIQDAMAIAMHRQLDDRHPLFRLLQKHFVAMMIINFGGELVLVGSTGIVAKILEEGGEGSAQLINEAYAGWSFPDLDFEEGLRKRGLWGKETLPYYPYRDDGKRIWDVLGNYVRGYLEHYYGPAGEASTDQTVQGDWELQAWLNELSADGTGDHGGKGRMKGMPASVSTLDELIDIVHKIVWTAGPQHAAVNFPQIEYASFVPNLPGANFQPPIEGPVTQADLMKMMPPAQTTLNQFTTTFELAGYHFDELLDYADSMDDDVRGIVAEHYAQLTGEVTTAITAANDAREQAGRLTYRWLLPQMIPNSTSV